MFTIITIMATVGIMVPSISGSVFADQGGIPDDSALSGKACENANERNFDRHHIKPGLDSEGHLNSDHNGKGVEYTYCY